MRRMLLTLSLSGLLATHAFPHGLAAAPPPAVETARPTAPAVGRFGRWVNRKTRPIGRTLQKVLPFRLVKKPRLLNHCCFPADTRISLPGGATCAIGELRVGQLVLGWNPATQALDTARVEALATVVHDSLRRLTFADGRTVTATADHPFWVKSVGWASLAPALTMARYATGPTQLLQSGDSCLVFGGTASLCPTPLREVATLTACGIPTYTITGLSRGSVFFANGLAVGVESDRHLSSRRVLAAGRLAKRRRPVPVAGPRPF